MEEAANSQGLLEETARFILLVELRRTMSKHHKLGHDGLVVHIAAQALQLVLEALLVEVKGLLMLTLACRNDAQVEVDFSHDVITDFIGSAF